MRISDWSSDVCSSDLSAARDLHATSPQPADPPLRLIQQGSKEHAMTHRSRLAGFIIDCETGDLDAAASFWSGALGMPVAERYARSEEHTSELQSLMRISYAVFCLKKKNIHLISSYSLHLSSP